MAAAACVPFCRILSYPAVSRQWPLLLCNELEAVSNQWVVALLLVPNEACHGWQSLHLCRGQV